eukprot:m.50440 g.50440  ORF g.50440 m.50440 type:complete len:145 (+) comp12152_c0_seq2:381-815(+)
MFRLARVVARAPVAVRALSVAAAPRVAAQARVAAATTARSQPLYLSNAAASACRFTVARSFGSAAAPTQEEIETKVLTILKNFDRVDPAKITLDAKFIDDLGLDSLDVVECVMAIEDEFAIEISDAQADSIQTPRDLVAFLLQQ